MNFSSACNMGKGVLVLFDIGSSFCFVSDFIITDIPTIDPRFSQKFSQNVLLKILYNFFLLV